MINFRELEQTNATLKQLQNLEDAGFIIEQKTGRTIVKKIQEELNPSAEDILEELEHEKEFKNN